VRSRRSRPTAATSWASVPTAYPESWLTPVDSRPLEFRTRGQKGDLTLVPLNRVFDERYAVYFKVIET